MKRLLLTVAAFLFALAAMGAAGTGEVAASGADPISDPCVTPSAYDWCD